jgi:Phage tail protein
MSLPSPTLSVPTLSNYQWFFQGAAATGVTLGPNTPFGFKKLEGIDLPSIRNGDSARPRTRGQYVGLDVIDARDITLTLDIGPLSTNFGGYGTLQGALNALRAVTNTQGTTEYPLWVQLPNFGLVAIMARCRKRSIPVDIPFTFGLAQNAVVQFHTTDPYFYASPTLAPSVSLPTPGIGFGFLPSGMSFNLSFGGGTTANTVTVTNSGDAPCYPQLVITGPCLNPSISNASLPGNPTLTFDIQLFAGDKFVIDLDMQSALYTASGSSLASPRLNTLQANSTWWAVIPGTNVVTFNSQDTTAAAGTLALWYSSAFSSVT